jgi:hypothetical protein
MNNREIIIEMIGFVLIIVFLVWCSYPAVGCDGKVVRGLVRLECVEVTSER